MGTTIAVLRSRHLALLAVVVPMAVLVVTQLRQAGAAVPAVSDFAVLELGTAAAGRGEQLLGPYSRFGWNHPGPFLFYWNVPFWAATGRHVGGLALAAAVLNTATLTGLVAVAGRIGGRTAAWCAAGGVLVLLVRFDIERMREAWNPTLTLTTTALTVGLAVAVATGRRWTLPLLALVASVTVQIHAGTGPTVVAVVLVAMGFAFTADRHGLTRWAYPALATVGVVGVMWTAPAVEQLDGSGGDGNLTELVTFFTEGNSTGQSGRDAVRAVVTLVSPSFDAMYNAPGRPPLPDRPELTVVDRAGATLLVGGLLIGAGFAVAARDRRLGAVTVMPLVAMAAAVVGAMSIDGPLLLYLLAFVTGAALVGWIALVAVTIELGRRVGRGAASRRSARSTTADVTARATTTNTSRVGLGLLGLAAGFGVVIAARLALATEPAAEVTRSATAVDLLPALTDAIEAAEADVVLLRIGAPTTWAVTAPLFDALEDDGIDVRIDPEWAFMFGDSRRATGDEEFVVSVLPTDDLVGLSGLAVVGEADGVTLAYGGTTVAPNGTAVGFGASAPVDGG